LHVFARIREQTRYVLGTSAWIGFRQTRVSYARPPRPTEHTEHTPIEMLPLTTDALMPPLAALRLGLLVAAASMLHGATSPARRP
jgi:hypothetical protein